MANENNLIPIRTKSEAREKGYNGGKASGEARRERKAMKEQLKLLLSLPMENDAVREQIKSFGIGDEEIDNQMAMTIALYKEAIQGNTKAYELIRDTIGEKPINKIELTKNTDEAIKDMED